MKRLQNPESGIQRVSPAEALPRILRYCAYQERSHQEVKHKLFEYGLRPDEVDELLSRLITEGFLNEERFAKAYAGGKFRVKKWGRLKIQNELEHRGLTKNCILRGLNEIESSDYSKALKELLMKKAGQISEQNLFKKRNQVARFVIHKGFEPDLVWETIKDLFPD